MQQTEYDVRCERFYDELKWLYCEMYEGGRASFDTMMESMKLSYKDRNRSLRMRDRHASANPDWYKSHRYDPKKCQIDQLMLNEDYSEEAAFLEIVQAMIEKANEGVQILKLQGVSNLFAHAINGFRDDKKQHNFLRMLRMISEIFSPSMVLMAVTEEGPETASYYLGSAEKPECHMVKDNFFLPTLWQTAATKDVRLLGNQIMRYAVLRKNGTFAYDLLPEGPLYWNIDYDYLGMLQTDEADHRNYLNRYFTGKYVGSTSSAKAVKGKNAKQSGVDGTVEELLGEEVSLIEVMHAVYMMQSGSLMSLPLADLPKGMMTKMKKQAVNRAKHQVFDADADVWTYSVANEHVLVFGRYKNGEKLYGLFNFSEKEQIFALHDPDTYKNLMTGKETVVNNLVRLQPMSFAWLLNERNVDESTGN